MDIKYIDLQNDSEEESFEEDEATANELTKKLKFLYKDLLNFKNPAGEELIEMFLEKPSQKLYPDYYKIIKNPIGKSNCVVQNFTTRGQKCKIQL